MDETACTISYIREHNILDEKALEALDMAKAILQISDGRFLAKARPESTSNARRVTSRVVMA